MGQIIVFPMAKKPRDYPNRIHALRSSKGWTLEELAHRAGISFPHVSNMERGERAINDRMAARLAAALGVTRGELLLPHEQARSADEQRMIEAWRAVNGDQQQALLHLAESMTGYRAQPAPDDLPAAPPRRRA